MNVRAIGRGVPALADCRSADVVVLELDLPDMDGFELCRLIRIKSQVPILVVALRDDECDHVLSLKMGADGYVVKPCRQREIAARIEAAVRRFRCHLDPARPAAAPRAEARVIGDVVINIRKHQVMVGGKVVNLTPKEFDLFALLASEPGRIFTREEIMAEVWPGEDVSDSRTLGVHMTNLRRKMLRPGIIKTVRGVGFRLAHEGE